MAASAFDSRQSSQLGRARCCRFWATMMVAVASHGVQHEDALRRLQVEALETHRSPSTRPTVNGTQGFQQGLDVSGRTATMMVNDLWVQCSARSGVAQKRTPTARRQLLPAAADLPCRLQLRCFLLPLHHAAASQAVIFSRGGMCSPRETFCVSKTLARDPASVLLGEDVLRARARPDVCATSRPQRQPTCPNAFGPELGLSPSRSRRSSLAHARREFRLCMSFSVLFARKAESACNSLGSTQNIRRKARGDPSSQDRSASTQASAPSSAAARSSANGRVSTLVEATDEPSGTKRPRVASV